MSTSLTTAGIGSVFESLRILEREGIRPEHLARLRSDEDYAKRVASVMLRGGLETPVDLATVRAIMGNDRVFGPEEWSALYGARLPKRIPAFPWSEDVLNAPCPFVKGKRIAETHFAFLGLARLNGRPLTIMRWHEAHPRTGQPRFHFDPDPWYGRQMFATDVTCQFRWFVMPLDIVPGSGRKTFQEQVAMLPDEYEVPSAVAEVTKNLLAFRKAGRYPNPNRWGRCTDVTSFGNRVLVGDGDEYGLYVGNWWDDYRDDYVGLAASRKS